MKHFVALSVAFALSILAYAQQSPSVLKKPKQSPFDKDLWWITDNRQSPSVKYVQPKEQEASIREEAKLKMWNEETLQSKLESSPQGGYLIGRVSARTVGAADPKWLTFVVFDSAGKEVFRYQPETQIPSPFSVAGTTVWYSTYLVPLPSPLQTGSKLYIINDIEKARYEYEARPL